MNGRSNELLTHIELAVSLAVEDEEVDNLIGMGVPRIIIGSEIRFVYDDVFAWTVKGSWDSTTRTIYDLLTSGI